MSRQEHRRTRLPAASQEHPRVSPTGRQPQRSAAGKYALETALVLATLTFVGQLASPAVYRWHHRPRAGVQGRLLAETSNTHTGRRAYNSLLYLPPQYGTPQAAWPLVVYLHGSGPRGADLELVRRVGLPALLESEFAVPAIVLSPQCEPGAVWQPDRVMATIDEASSKYQIDARRICLTGCSRGGYATWATAAAFPDKFLAIAPICGRSNLALAANLKGVPIWAFHGAIDSVIPARESISMVAAVREAGGNAKLTIYQEAGHDIAQRPFLEQCVIDWLLHQ